jgi:hypothetical protein
MSGGGRLRRTTTTRRLRIRPAGRREMYPATATATAAKTEAKAGW